MGQYNCSKECKCTLEVDTPGFKTWFMYLFNKHQQNVLSVPCTIPGDEDGRVNEVGLSTFKYLTPSGLINL